MMNLGKIAEEQRSYCTPPHCFTLQSANRTLIYVRKVTADIQKQYATLLQRRAERNDLIAAGGSLESIEAIGKQVEEAVNRLNELYGELHEVGCELKDWETGLVDFPSVHNGEPINYCWKPDEMTIQYWHRSTEGYIDRKPITSEMK